MRELHYSANNNYFRGYNAGSKVKIYCNETDFCAIDCGKIGMIDTNGHIVASNPCNQTTVLVKENRNNMVNYITALKQPALQPALRPSVHLQIRQLIHQLLKLVLVVQN